MNPITLTGYLGADRKIRSTRPRTLTVTRYNDLAGREVEEEITTASREFIQLSLAVHRPRRPTTWYRLICWNSDRTMEHFGVRLGRKGDKVRVVGRTDTYSYLRGGERHTVEQIVVEEFQILRAKTPQAP